MLRAGNEFLHAQGGNNNTHNQDNATSWLDWDRLESNASVARFVRLMIASRKAHPSLARSRFWRDDVRWHGVGPPAGAATLTSAQYVVGPRSVVVLERARS
jgi:glycogen operon protein